MDKQQVAAINQLVTDTIDEEKDEGVLQLYAAKFKEFKLNVKARKLIAKDLKVDEKNALTWQTVADVFSFIDTSTLAKEHPKQAVKLLKEVAAIIGLVFPPTLPFMTLVIALPQDKAAQLMEWLGKPTPEHIAYKIATKKANKKKQIEEKKD